MKNHIRFLLILFVLSNLIFAKNTVDNFSPIQNLQTDQKHPECENSDEFPCYNTNNEDVSVKNEFSYSSENDFKITSLPYEKKRITIPLNLGRSIFEDDFETDKGWTFNGEWEKDVPTGSVYYDPAADHTEDPGDKVLGHDVTGLGVSPYWYENNLADHAEWAISPTIDCSGYSNVIVSFWRWLGIDSSNNDYTYIDVSNDNGLNWFQVWENPTEFIFEQSWSQYAYDVSTWAAGESQVKIRFSDGSTNGSMNIQSWNIDDLQVCEGSVLGRCCDYTDPLNPICYDDYSEDDCNVIDGEWIYGVSCLEEPCTDYQTGDICESPIQINIPSELPYSDVGQTTCGRIDDYQGTCLYPWDYSEDIIYELIVSSDSWLEITIDPKTTPYTCVSLDNECPDSDQNCLMLHQHEYAEPYSLGCSYFSAGTYYMMIDNAPAYSCIPEFDLSITVCEEPTGRCCDEIYPDNFACYDDYTLSECDAVGGDWLQDGNCTDDPCISPYGEDCENAVEITVLPWDIIFDNDQATADEELGSCHSPYPPNLMQNDAWFKYTATDDIFLQLEVMELEFTNMLLAIYEGTDCNNLTEIYCINDPEPYSYGFSAVTGNTYWFQIGEYGIYEGGGMIHFLLEGGTLGRCCDDTDPDNPLCYDGYSQSECDAIANTYWFYGGNCNDDPSADIIGNDCYSPIRLTLPADLPFSDFSQTTCGRLNDYYQTCLGDYDNDEDTVYELTVTDTVIVTISMDPGSSTYTGLLLVDDCPGIDQFCKYRDYGQSDVRTMEYQKLVPGTYYVMVSSWSNCIPSYDLTITESPVCSTIACLPGDTPENEPTYFGTYYSIPDTINNGCWSNEPNFGNISCGETICGTTSTYYLYDNGDKVYARDTDEFLFSLTEPKMVTLTAEADLFDPKIAVFQYLDDPEDCDYYDLDFIENVGYCETGVLTIGLCPGNYRVWLGHNEYLGVEFGANYRLTLECDSWSPMQGECCENALSYLYVDDPYVYDYIAPYELVWYEFVNPICQDVSVSLCDSNFDTVLEIWEVCNDSTGYQGWSDDYDCSGRIGRSVQSQIDFNCLSAGTYYAKIYGYEGDSGQYVLEITGGSACSPPGTPQNVQITQDGIIVTITWEASETGTVNRYEVRSDTDPYGSFTTLEDYYYAEPYEFSEIMDTQKFYRIVDVNYCEE